MDSQLERNTQREISTTTRWGVGIMLTILIQSGTAIWFLSGLNSQSNQNALVAQENSISIKNLQQGAAVILTREQLDDILSSRDIRLDNIETTLKRIESKL